jgi:hypothetical protein
MTSGVLTGVAEGIGDLSHFGRSSPVDNCEVQGSTNHRCFFPFLELNSSLKGDHARRRVSAKSNTK